MQTESDMVGEGLKGKVRTKPVGFRCPEDLAQWIESLAPGKREKSGAFIYSLEQGRELIEAAGPEIAKKLDGYAAILGMSRTEVLRRILEKGLAEFERELRKQR